MNKLLRCFRAVALLMASLFVLSININELAANNERLDEKALHPPICEVSSSYSLGSFFPNFDYTADKSLKTVTCNTDKVCRNGKIYTERKINYDCVTVIILPSCKPNEIYDATTCACKPRHHSTCNKACDSRVVCDGNGWLFKQVLNTRTCQCETVEVSKPVCPTGKEYDPKICDCKPKAQPCSRKCSDKVLCDGRGNYYKEELNTRNCTCIKVYVPDHKPTCNEDIVCDGRGNFYKEVYDNNSCDCVKIFVPGHRPTCNEKPVCDGRGNFYKEIYDDSSCDCVKIFVPGNRPTCNEKPVCDGRGNFYKEVYDDSSCDCVKVLVSDYKPVCNEKIICDGRGNYFKEVFDYDRCDCIKIQVSGHRPICDERPVCDGQGNYYKEIYNKNKCSCVKVLVPDAKPTCVAGEVYDPKSCSCKPVLPPECLLACDNKIRCVGNGKLVKEVLNKEECKCETVLVTQNPCPSGTTYNPTNCSCQPIVCTKTCDSRIFCDGRGNLTTEKLDKSKCVCETVAVPRPTCPKGKVFNPQNCGCKDDGSNILDCNNIKIKTDRGAIILSDLTAPKKIVKVFDEKWKLIYDCYGNCKETIVIPHLYGKYKVNIGFYNQAWHYVCGINKVVYVDDYSDLSGAASSRNAFNASDNNFDKSKLYRVYPNPAREVINVQLPNYAGQAGVIRIIDQFGKVIRQLNYDAIPEEIIQVDTDLLENGLYFINITVDSHHTITEKIMVNKAR